MTIQALTSHLLGAVQNVLRQEIPQIPVDVTVYAPIVDQLAETLVAAGESAVQSGVITKAAVSIGTAVGVTAGTAIGGAAGTALGGVLAPLGATTGAAIGTAIGASIGTVLGAELTAVAENYLHSLQ